MAKLIKRLFRTSYFYSYREERAYILNHELRKDHYRINELRAF